MKGGKDCLRGLVVSGGASRRMGRDKGLIVSGSMAWVNRAGMLLQGLNLPVSVMVREAQRAEYAAAVLPDFELLSDVDLAVGGPLKGLLSFHQFYPQNDVLALPCDMPYLTVGLLTELMEFYLKKPDYEAWVFENQGILQPFAGIYSARLLRSVFEKVRRGELARHGLKHLLDSAKTASQVVDDEPSFQNRNNPFDF